MTTASEPYVLNIGPQHPSTHGVLRVVMKLDGERVIDVDPVLGYLHRGVEKLCENADFHHTIAYMDPLEYVSSLFCEWPVVMATAVLAMLPPVAVVVLMQKLFVRGLVETEK